MEKDLRKLSAEELFDYIKNHREEFDQQLPDPDHEKKFFNKLGRLIKKAVISIIPHLVKVAIITLVIWLVSIITWKLFLDPERDQMPMGKASKEYRVMERNYQYDINSKKRSILYYHRFRMSVEERKNFVNNLDSLDKDYVHMKRELKKNPNNKEILQSMKMYYDIKADIVDKTKNRIDTTQIK